jgi:hypothetical protein
MVAAGERESKMAAASTRFARYAGGPFTPRPAHLLVGSPPPAILSSRETRCIAVVDAAPKVWGQASLRSATHPASRGSNMISPEMLRRYPYFVSVGEESLKRIAMMADEVNVDAGTRMFNEGEPANQLYVIVQGEVNVQYQLGNDELRTVDTLVGGDILVWSAIIAPYKTTAIGTATKPTQLIQIDAVKLRALCEEDPRVGYQLVIEVAKLLAHRLEGARAQLASVD